MEEISRLHRDVPYGWVLAVGVAWRAVRRRRAHARRAVSQAPGRAPPETVARPESVARIDDQLRGVAQSCADLCRPMRA